MELSIDTKNILGLQLPTDPRWVDLASISLEEILTDHAYCEQKAATTCISLIQKYAQYEKLVTELAPIVTEEWGHFRLVLAELHKRGLSLGKQRKDEYVNKLIEFQRKGGHLEDRFLDQLLTMALIEARSCERFKRLSEGLNVPIYVISIADLWKARPGITPYSSIYRRRIWIKLLYVNAGLSGCNTKPGSSPAWKSGATGFIKTAILRKLIIKIFLRKRLTDSLLTKSRLLFA
jgi:hypothetical protein